MCISGWLYSTTEEKEEEESGFHKAIQQEVAHSTSGKVGEEDFKEAWIFTAFTTSKQIQHLQSNMGF